MKRWLFLLLTAPAFAQNATVTANLKQLGGGAAQPTGASIRVDLQNCAAPRVPGTGNIGEKSRTFYPNTSGVATVTLFSNTVIDCGAGVPSTPVSFYTFNLVSNGGVISLGSYKVPAGASTLDTLTPITTTPVIPTPSGDTSYLRLDLSNFSNLVQPIPHLDITSLLTAGSAAIPIVNSVVIAGGYASLNAASAACPLGGGCTIEVNNTIALSANLTLPTTTTLRFNQPGKINLSGFSLTTGPVEAAPYSIFTNGTLTLSSLISRAPVEWFGAVGDWNGSSGTDNTVSINACLADLQAGQCVLQAKKYMISAVLNITRSNIGIRGQTRSVPNSSLYPTPTGSIIITTSTTSNLINVFGTSTSNNIAFNQFNDFTLQRSSVPATTARGMQFNFTYGVAVDGVAIEDSPGAFYIHASGSQDIGGFTNDVAAWGYSGFAATSGSYCGFCIDSLDGTPSPSLRIFNSGTFSALGSGVTTYGISDTGTSLEDLHVRNYETAGLSYGEAIQTAASPLSATDIHLWNTINDGCQISCMLFTTGTAPASIEVNGGWSFKSSTNTAPIIDLESASYVTLSNHDIYFPSSPGSGPYALVNGGHNDTITGNQFLGSGTASAVSAIGATYLTVTDNQMPSITATNVISLATVQHGVISNNNISGTGTNGILLDASTQGIAGLPSNAINGTFTATISDLGINPTQPLFFQIGNGSIYKDRQQIRQTSSLCTATASASCTFTVTFPTAFPDTAWKGSCMVENATGAGVISQMTTTSRTTTTAVATFRDLSAASNTLTSVVCEGWE